MNGCTQVITNQQQNNETNNTQNYCNQSKDCDGAPHINCLGEWSCVENTCEWNCKNEIANPASVKCIEDGGELKILTDSETGGQFGLCVFDNNSYCEEWKYFRGECDKGEQKMVCGLIGTRSEGWFNEKTKKLLYYDNCGGENE